MATRRRRRRGEASAAVRSAGCGFRLALTARCRDGRSRAAWLRLGVGGAHGASARRSRLIATGATGSGSMDSAGAGSMAIGLDRGRRLRCGRLERHRRSTGATAAALRTASARTRASAAGRLFGSACASVSPIASGGQARSSSVVEMRLRRRCAARRQRFTQQHRLFARRLGDAWPRRRQRIRPRLERRLGVAAARSAAAAALRCGTATVRPAPRSRPRGRYRRARCRARDLGSKHSGAKAASSRAPESSKCVRSIASGSASTNGSFGFRRRAAFRVFAAGAASPSAAGFWRLRLCRGRIGSGRPWRVGPFHTVLASPRCYIRSAYRPLPKGLGGLARRY